MPAHDLVIRSGNVVDGSGGPARTADIAIDGGVITEVGAVSGTGRREIDADGALVTPGLRRHPHPLRRPVHLGHRAGPVQLARRHDGRDGQLRRRLRARPPGRPRPPDRADGGRRGHPRRRPPRGPLVGVAVVPRVPRRHRRQAPRHRPRRPGPARGDAPQRDGRARRQPRAGHARTTSRRWPRWPARRSRPARSGSPPARTLNHRSSKGELTPSLNAEEDELVGIAEALGSIGQGVLQVVSDFKDVDAEFDLFRTMAQRSGRPISISVAQAPQRPEQWRYLLDRMTEARKDGIMMRGQCAARAVGLLLGFEATLNPFMLAPLWKSDLRDLPMAERVGAPAPGRRPPDPARAGRRRRQEPRRPRRPADLPLRHDVPARRSAGLRARPPRLDRRPGRARGPRPGRGRLRRDDGQRRQGDALPAVAELRRRHARRRRRAARPPVVGRRPLRRRGPRRHDLRRQLPDLAAAVVGPRPPERPAADRAARAQADPGDGRDGRPARPRPAGPGPPRRRQRHRLRGACACTRRSSATTCRPAAAGCSSAPTATCTRSWPARRSAPTASRPAPRRAD